MRQVQKQEQLVAFSVNHGYSVIPRLHATHRHLHSPGGTVVLLLSSASCLQTQHDICPPTQTRP